jgi:hypothetical protein
MFRMVLACVALELGSCAHSDHKIGPPQSASVSHASSSANDLERRPKQNEENARIPAALIQNEIGPAIPAQAVVSVPVQKNSSNWRSARFWLGWPALYVGLILLIPLLVYGMRSMKRRLRAA